MNKTLLDEREVSVITGVPAKTPQYWRFAGTRHATKFIKLGTRVYCRWQDLEQWIAERPSFSSATQAKHQGTITTYVVFSRRVDKKLQTMPRTIAAE